MKIENGKLVVINENLKKYILNPITGNDYNHYDNLVLIIFCSISFVIMIGFIIKLQRKRNLLKIK